MKIATTSGVREYLRRVYRLSTKEAIKLVTIESAFIERAATFDRAHEDYVGDLIAARAGLAERFDEAAFERYCDEHGSR